MKALLYSSTTSNYFFLYEISVRKQKEKSLLKNNTNVYLNWKFNLMKRAILNNVLDVHFLN